MGRETIHSTSHAFVTVLFGSQGLIYVLRERRHLWSSVPSKWGFASSAADIGIVTALALSGTLMAPLPWPLLLIIFFAAAAVAVLLDELGSMSLGACR